MFKVVDLKKAVGEAMDQVEAQKASGRQTPSRELEQALKEVSQLWESQDCITYRESLGKLTLMANQPDGMWDKYVRTMDYGHKVNLAVKIGQYTHPSLDMSLTMLYSGLQIMEFNAEDIDAHFANA